jgi:hypothetical protein
MNHLDEPGDSRRVDNEIKVLPQHHRKTCYVSRGTLRCKIGIEPLVMRQMSSIETRAVLLSQSLNAFSNKIFDEDGGKTYSKVGVLID